MRFIVYQRMLKVGVMVFLRAGRKFGDILEEEGLLSVGVGRRIYIYFFYCVRIPDRISRDCSNRYVKASEDLEKGTGSFWS